MSCWATVETAPADSEVAPGDLVVGIVRRPDPQPCSACAVGEWDMCRNGGYTERGIKERHGYGAERFRIEPEFVVKVDPPWISWACCWSPPASWPRHGIIPSASASAPADGNRGACW